ncbi:hypothetical protein D3C76_1623070 [compost metagenome]
MRITIKNCDACLISPIANVFAPAVRGVIDWNKELRILPPQFKDPNVLVFVNSNINITTAPSMIRNVVEDNTTFVCKDNLPILRKSTMSDKTINPIPPDTMRNMTTKFTSGSYT